MTIYSHSRLSTFEQCPQKFKFRYIDKIKTIEKSIESLLGFAVHNVLEFLYNESKIGRIPSVEEVITIYDDTWNENYNDNIIIVKTDLNEKDYFNKGVEFLTNYYTKNYPFKDNTLETEKRIFLKLDQLGNYKMIGFIDRLVYNLEEKRYEIHDYKTSNSLPSQESIDNDRQLALYSIAIKEIFGKDKEVVLIWHYLAHNQKIISKRTNEQLEQLKQETIEIIKKIESAENFPTYVSKLCDWCEYKRICPAWNKNRNNHHGYRFDKQKKLEV